MRPSTEFCIDLSAEDLLGLPAAPQTPATPAPSDEFEIEITLTPVEVDALLELEWEDGPATCSGGPDTGASAR